MGIPRTLFNLFSSFQTQFTIFTTNKFEKCPSSIRCWDSNSRSLEHESPPITTRPGLPFTHRVIRLSGRQLGRRVGQEGKAAVHPERLKSTRRFKLWPAIYREGHFERVRRARGGDDVEGERQRGRRRGRVAAISWIWVRVAGNEQRAFGRQNLKFARSSDSGLRKSVMMATAKIYFLEILFFYLKIIIIVIIGFLPFQILIVCEISR